MSPLPPTTPSPLSTALDLWRALAARAGIELHRKGGREGRDYDLPDAILDELFERSGIDRRGEELADVLAREPDLISTELLLRSALGALRPFGAMMSDVLGTLAGAGARSDGGVLRVRFPRGDGGDPLDQTLDAFREAVEQVARALALAEPLLPEAALLDSLYDALRGLGGEVRSWENVARGTEPLPPLAPSGDAGVDAALDDLRLALNAMRSWMAGHGVDADGRSPWFQACRERRDMAPGDALLAMQADVAQRGTDVLDGSLYALADDVRLQVAQRRLQPAAVAAALAPLVAQLPRAQRWVETAIQVLTDILNLPVWRKRSELYAVWIGCRLLRTVGAHAQDLQLHAPEGVLAFGFGGALLGVYSWGGLRHEVWAELRADMAHGTLFHERKQAIQPDFRVVAATPADRNEATRLVVECKHYLVAKPGNFVAAADDYARNCEHATVLLVNHGPLDAAGLRAQLQSPVHERVEFLGDVVPDAAGAGIAPLERAAARVLFPAAPAAAVLAARATDAVRVRWNVQADIDLGLVHLAADGVRTEVGFGSRGSLQHHPFALLAEDVRSGPGTEVITVERWLPGCYDVIVSDYGAQSRLRPGDVSCFIVYEGVEIEIAFPPQSPPLNVWHVARIDTSKRAVQVGGF